MRILFFVLLFISLSFAKNELFLLPNEANNAKDKIVELIKDSNKSITIAMYNFSYKKFAKALVKKQKKGVDITVVFDEKKIKEDDTQYNYLKDNGIHCVVANKKMHLKVAIFDGKTMLIGSTNFTKKSFSDNYEIVLINDDKKSIKKIKAFLKDMN